MRLRVADGGRVTIYPVPKPVREKVRSRSSLRQKKRMRKINKKRGGHAFPKNVDEARRDFIRAQPCILSGRMGKAFGPDSYWFTAIHHCFAAVRACHVKSRGAGGKDVGNMYPGCDSAHDEQHRIGIPAFEKRWGVNLKEIAQRLEAEYSGSLAPTHPQEHQ